MLKFRLLGLSGLLIGLLGQVDCRQKSQANPNIVALVEAERSFAHTSQTEGMRTAFLTFLADDAIVFRPRPIKGKSLYNQSSTTPGMLTWLPVFADISAAGDLGYTTGPFAFRKAGGDGQPDGYGHYVSLWKKQASGEWRVALDAGISHPAPDSDWAAAGTVYGKQNRKSDIRMNKARIDVEKEAILALEHNFARESSKSSGFRIALQSYCTSNVRIYRNNHLPALSYLSADFILRQEPNTLQWETQAVEMSASGDLAYTYGLAVSIPLLDSDPGQNFFSFLRIWQKQDHNVWKIVLDLANPIPADRDQKSEQKDRP